MRMIKRIALYVWILAVIMTVTAIPVLGEDRKASELLQAGLTKETIAGELGAAIGLYQSELGGIS